jgi:hypothetical protein
MYLTAGFLLKALFQIKEQLKGTDFNSKAMVIHIVAVLLNFVGGILSFVTDVLFHDNRISNIIFLISNAMYSIVIFMECFIFIQISR